ncbi:MAG: sulfatase-like hydrolase/transferase [Proteobacteria bacterium]|nr:sulfatase-like hydrolase/transferase [Pseudomonadota bacterium]
MRRRWPAVFGVVFAGVLGAGLSCGEPEGPHGGVAELQGTFLFSRHPAAVTKLVNASHNRPEGRLRAPSRFALTARFAQHETKAKSVTWKTLAPIGGVWLAEHRGKRPSGMSIFHHGKALEYAKHDAGPNTWWTDGDTLYVRLEPDVSPAASDFECAFPRAAAHSRMLNDATDPRNGKKFALRSQAMGDDERRGIYLPAPSAITYKVDVASSSAIRGRVHLLPPGIGEGLVSDGASLTLSVRSVDGTERTKTLEVNPGDSLDLELVLEGIEGPSEVTFTTDPGEDRVFDYLFVEEPSLEPAEPGHGRRVVLVFLDTVRYDHLSIADHHRDTTPALAAFAKDAAVFTEARTVAAWTLPSARAAYTGRQPEHWPQAKTLPAILGEHGFVSSHIATNGFTAAEYEMHRGFSEHLMRFLEPADALTTRAVRMLEEHKSDDYLMVVQYMDAHLPYLEPPSHATLWAAAKPPPSLGKRPKAITLNTLQRLPNTRGARAEALPYLKARYDQNLRFIDDQLVRLFAELDENDVVVVFADHGEEFLDHGYWEHGQSLHEEIVHVPLVMRGPGIGAGRFDSPSSLIDIVPSVLDALGIDSGEELDGESLLPVTRSDPEAVEAFSHRSIALGRTLYFGDHWGVISERKKWITTEGRERLYDLDRDPTERVDLAGSEDLDVYPALLAEALGGQVEEVWLLQGPGRHKFITPGEVEVEVTHPDGFAASWRPSAISAVVNEPRLKDGKLKLRVRAKGKVIREVYLMGQPGSTPEGLTLTVTIDGETHTATATAAAGNVLVEAGSEKRRYRIVRARTPVFTDGTLDTYSEAMTGALQELGYLE